MERKGLYATYPSLSGKFTIITGGASGIGAELVEQFVRQGARVAFLDNDRESAYSLLDRIKDLGRFAPQFEYCDIREISQLRSAILKIEAKSGGTDILINNAASDDRHIFSEVDPEYWDERMNINLRHQIFATQFVSIRMKERGCGSIIMMGSVSWMRGRAGMIAYTTAKAAIHGATKTLARELGPAGIRVNCIAPGLVVTERVKAKWFTSEMVNQFVENQSLRFALTPPDIARMALFLASDDSRGCTGQSYIVDAGVC